MERRSMTTLTSYEVGSSSEKQREEMKHIPQDMIEKIQLRLPVKSIIRFRLVSKFWYTVPSDAYFIKSHLNFVKNNPPLDLVEFRWNNEVSIYEKGVFKCVLWTPIPVNHPDNGLVGSCNGLVCMHEDNEIIVFNPATRTSVYLPISLSFQESYTVSPREGNWNFGFNPHANEYKVIHFFEEKNPNQTMCRVKVFTLGKDTKLWREIKGGAPMVPFDEAINISPTIYWKLELPDSVISILFFDLSEERFGQIEPPKEESNNGQIYCTMDLNGRFCWVSVNPERDDRVILNLIKGT